MLNIIILYVLTILLAVSVILSAAELFCARNTPSGRFVRFFLIRLREYSMTQFFVISIISLFWGFIVHDTYFGGIMIMILLLLSLLITLHPEDFFSLAKRRKKCKKKTASAVPAKKSAEAAIAKEAAVLTEHTPASNGDS